MRKVSFSVVRLSGGRNPFKRVKQMQTKTPEPLYFPAPRLNQFYILSEVAANPHVTQAELARSCGLSVAMVNNYMKDLSGTGLLEYRRKSSKSVSYHVTAAGEEYIAAIEHELVHELTGLFGQAKERVRNLIACQAGGELRRIVLYGTGPLAEVVFHALESDEVNIVGVCDDDPAAIGRDWCGMEVLHPSRIRMLMPDHVLVTTSGLDGVHGSLRVLQDQGIPVLRLDGHHAGRIELETEPVSN